jgi:hypothetical protein
MNVLGKLGMSLSENLIPGSLENPEGYFEDAEIVQIHKQLYSDLRTKPTLPLPADWRESGATREARRKLSLVLSERLRSAKTIWGFKDPRICSLIPLWVQIFNPARVVPAFVLAVRNPASVVMSLQRHYNMEESTAELLWLQRTCDAISHTAADCYIVHYEEWFTNQKELARDLSDYTGLSGFSDTKNAEELLGGIIKPNLNRAQYEDYSIRNQWVAKLYTQLQQCHGSDFDRKALMEVVKECRSVMEQFKGWADVTHRQMVATRNETQVAMRNEARIAMLEQQIETAHHEAKGACDEANAREKQLIDELNTIRADAIAHEKELEMVLNKAELENSELFQQAKDMESELEKMVLENNRLLQQVKDLFNEVKNLQCSAKPVNRQQATSKPTQGVEKQRAGTAIRTTSSSQLMDFILLAKRRLASFFPGLYKYYKTFEHIIRH